MKCARAAAVTLTAWFALVFAACPDTEAEAEAPEPLSCHLVFHYAKSCSDCIEAQCCEEAGACAIDFECKSCVQPSDLSECVSPPPPSAVALGDCIGASCLADCAPPWAREVGVPDCDVPAVAPSFGACVDNSISLNQCNPVTNLGCDGDADESCGPRKKGFTCEPNENVRDLCEPCGYAHDYCRLGMTCIGRCARNCCNDADCGPSGRCDTDYWLNAFEGSSPPPGLGVCVEG